MSTVQGFASSVLSGSGSQLSFVGSVGDLLKNNEGQRDIRDSKARAVGTNPNPNHDTWNV